MSSTFEQKRSFKTIEQKRSNDRLGINHQKARGLEEDTSKVEVYVNAITVRLIELRICNTFQRRRRDVKWSVDCDFNPTFHPAYWIYTLPKLMSDEDASSPRADT